MKTVIEHLESIRSEHAREKAIANLNANIENGTFTSSIKQFRVPNKTTALLGSFDFETSPEGINYWEAVLKNEAILDKLEEYVGQPQTMN